MPEVTESQIGRHIEAGFEKLANKITEREASRDRDFAQMREIVLKLEQSVLRIVQAFDGGGGRTPMADRILSLERDQEHAVEKIEKVEEEQKKLLWWVLGSLGTAAVAIIGVVLKFVLGVK